MRAAAGSGRLAMLALLLAATGATTARAQDSSRVRSVLPVQGEVVDLRLADVDGDGLRDLLLVLRLDGGQRRLRIHRLRPDGAYPASADLDLEVKTDIVCWGVGEFRPEEPGIELLLCTRAGAYQLSPRVASYGGNIRRFARADLLLDLPSERELPFWAAVADVDGDGLDEVALVTTDGFEVVHADGRVLGRVELLPARGRAPALERVFALARSTFSSQPLADLLVPDEDPGAIDPPPLLFAEESLPMPFFADANGDGLLDLLYSQGGYVFVHRQRSAAELEIVASPILERGPPSPFPADPDQILPVGDSGEMRVERIELVAVRGTPAADLLVTRAESNALLGGGDWQFLLFVDAFTRERLGPPDGVVTVDASSARGYLRDLDGDQRMDLVVSAWSLELSAFGTRGVDINHAVTTFLGDEKGFARRASSRYRRAYSADDFTAFSLVPPLPGDLDGDGRPDLLESDPHGVLEVHPLQLQGGNLVFASQATQTMKVDALRSSVSVEDANADGVGDFFIVPFRQPLIEAYVSRKP